MYKLRTPYQDQNPLYVKSPRFTKLKNGIKITGIVSINTNKLIM